MSDSNSTPAATVGKTSKPNKPHADYPLFAHASGQWAKKIRGKTHYFGLWTDPQAALVRYLDQKDALLAGRKPRERAEGTTVKSLCNAFLASKQALVNSGELLARTWTDYKFACDLIVEQMGKSRLVEDLGPDDFAALRNYMATRWAVTSVRSVIQRVRCVFKFAADNRLIAEAVCYGQNFKRPSPKVMRLERARRGVKLFSREEIHQLLAVASVPMRAMILLGLNAGYGNTDCGTLLQSAIDWQTGMVDFPRVKTGIPRRCWLWPETLSALREAIAMRPEPRNPEHAGLVFVTQRGLAWAKDVADSPVTKEMRKLLSRCGIKDHRNFYSLRHSFRTIGDEAKDQPAADFIMGHETASMSTVYRESISDARLRAVSEYVRTWLFGNS